MILYFSYSCSCPIRAGFSKCTAVGNSRVIFICLPRKALAESQHSFSGGSCYIGMFGPILVLCFWKMPTVPRETPLNTEISAA